MLLRVVSVYVRLLEVVLLIAVADSVYYVGLFWWPRGLKTFVCCCSLPAIAGSNLAGVMDVCLF
jgi:hypothetical protein